MTRKAWVYKITSPSGRIYVGSTLNVPKRKSAYRCLSIPSQTKIYRSLLKYGFESHSFEVICECTYDNVREKEAYYGILFNTLCPNKGLNCNLPKHGEGISAISENTRGKMRIAKLGRKLSLEHRKKISNSNVGKHNKKRTPEQNDRNRIAQTGKKLSQEHKEKLRITSTGRKHSLESIEKIKLINKGRKHTAEHIAKNRAAQLKRAENLRIKYV